MAVQPEHIQRAARILILRTSLMYCEKTEYVRRRQMRYIKKTRPFSWFFLPKYWKIESDQALLFRGVINFRKQIANYEKERNSG